MDNIKKILLSSEEPSIKFKFWANVMDKDSNSQEIKKLQQEIKSSARVQRLLSEREYDGKIPFHPYKKWYGAHWVLATLADIGYPSKDNTLIPLREQVLNWLLSAGHKKGIKTINGRVRRCASQEGNTIFSILSLGLWDDKVKELVYSLIKWQWVDGGWNCDKRPEAINSSFMETLIPLRALALYAKLTKDEKIMLSVERATEIFLKRRLFKGQRDGNVISEDFIRLHYPCYWHYDILFALKVITEAGFIHDKRCNDALDLLESKRLDDGGFPAEGKYYRVTEKKISGKSLVDWGPVSEKRMNPFVTVDALYVLKEAGRIKVD